MKRVSTALSSQSSECNVRLTPENEKRENMTRGEDGNKNAEKGNLRAGEERVAGGESWG